MHKAFHRSLAAGVTLVGVGAIALVPVPRQSDFEVRVEARRVVTTEIVPTAFANNAQLLIDGALASLQQSAQSLTTTSPALLQQAMANWPIAETELAYSQIANALVVPLMPLVAGPFTEAVTEVLARSAPALREQIETIPVLAEHVTVRMLGPFLAAVGGAGAAHADIYRATATGDLPGFVAGVLNVPRYMTEGFLLGGYGDIGPLLSGDDGRVVPAPGLLTPWNSDLEGAAPDEIQAADAVEIEKAPEKTWQWGMARDRTDRVDEAISTDTSEPADTSLSDSDAPATDSSETDAPEDAESTAPVKKAPDKSAGDAA